MGRANKTVVACSSTTEQTPPEEEWEQVLTEELAFDFSPRMTPPCGCPPGTCDQEKGGVKEAILRWLEEQL